MNLKFFLGIIIGFVIGAVISPLSYSDALEAIPPTPAWKIFGVLTDWAENRTYTNVTSDDYKDKVFFVSDGSIEFNVTESYP